MTSPLVVLDPKKEIHFPGPYNKPFTVNLVIENVSKKEVAFRLMTLEPRHYTVDPSKGIIQAHKSATVSIHLKPIDKVVNFKTATQKFMVQVVPAQPDSTVDKVGELFAKALTGDISYFKLIAVFDNLGKPEKVESAITSEPSSSSTATSSQTSTGSSSKSSPKIEPSFDKFLPSKIESAVGAEKSSAAEAQKTNSSSELVGEAGKVGGEDKVVKSNSKWTEVSNAKSGEAAKTPSVKTAIADAPVKEGVTPAKKEVASEAKQDSKSINNSIHSSGSDSPECPYMSSYKYVAIAVGIVLLGAIIYRQCTHNSGSGSGQT